MNNPMHPILLHPTDLLFFKDGRPMGGAASGHGAAWPLPHTLNAAFHAALHRADLPNAAIHNHRSRSGIGESRVFGSLKSVGPFPVCTHGAAHTWFFPRPLDAGIAADQPETLLAPVAGPGGLSASSLPAPLRYPVGSLAAPTKESPKAWWSEGAWNRYLGTAPRDALAARVFFKSDSDFYDTEHTYGIGMNPETGTTENTTFYSAQYLRLREGMCLGAFAGAFEDKFQDPEHPGDLLKAALAQTENLMTLGGQQRSVSCTFSDSAVCLPIPLGKRADFLEHQGKFLVKWVLLSPSIWPVIGRHTGGWLPSWIDHETGAVLLKTGDTDRRQGESRESWRKRVAAFLPIAARLVGAVVGKPLPITGFALPNESASRTEGGAKSTHLAVPAGSVYYFEAESAAAAGTLADALNWHGPEKSSIRRLRSNLMGEKGFGLGVCGTWKFHPASH